MAKVEIDNVKMWESIIRRIKNNQERHPNYNASVSVYNIEAALMEQGLEYKDGYIISILEPNWTIEEGKWYIGVADNLTYGIEKGKVYFGRDNNIVQTADGKISLIVDRDNISYFQPATEEEIKGNNGGISPKFKKGDIIRRGKTTLIVGHINTAKSFYELTTKEHFVVDTIPFKEQNEWELVELSKFQVGDYVYIKEKDVEGWITDVLPCYSYLVQTSDWELPFNEIELELVEPKQENIPTFKELERNRKDELTEFEQMLVSLILRTEKTILTPDGLAKEFAPKLMNLARKQIASEIDVDAMADKYAANNYHLSSNFILPIYRQGIEDVLNKIKEG